ARVNDRGRECTTCLLTLSGATAAQIGASYQARVSVERVGFSNWNPAPAVANRSNQPAAYQSPQTTIYANSPAAGGVVRPVTIQGDASGWQPKAASAPASYGSAYQQPNAYYGNTAASNYATLGAPQANVNSVMTREVNPSTRSNQPATYSRYPTTVRPQSPNVAAPVYQPVRQPQAYGTVSSPAATQSVVRPFQPNAQSGPQQYAATQAAPPAPTVARYQDQRTLPAPATYQSPSLAARSVQPYNAAAAAVPTQGYVVQLGAYNNELYAKNRVNQLRQAGLTNVFYRSSNKADGQVINRVYAGTYASMADAQTESNNIRLAHGIAGIVTSL
ncbi:MAG: SPOR domain-containing protein, partial [Bacteroidota bacterium]